MSYHADTELEKHLRFEERQVFRYLPRAAQRALAAEHAQLRATGYPAAAVKAHAAREMALYRRWVPPHLVRRIEAEHNGLGAFDEEQRKALAVTSEELAKLDPQQRADFLLRYAELKAQKRSDFWSAVESIATGALPILAFLGVTTLWGRKR